MVQPILESRDVSKHFARKNGTGLPALRHVSLRLDPGETLAIVGESGCGKSTLAKILCRLIDASSGTVHLLGQDITRARGRALRRIYREMQMVFQNPAGSFDPRRTLGYSIGESLRNCGWTRRETERRVAGLLEQCGLEAEFARRYPHEVSGGQCQRAAIARALAIDPKILVCDEATSALDMTVQKQIMDLLAQLKKTHRLSYLFICHNLALIQAFCDRVVVMHHGEIVEEGLPDDVIFSPQSPYTKRLAAAVM